MADREHVTKDRLNLPKISRWVEFDEPSNEVVGALFLP
jgi:hypothetical protein